MAEHLTKLWPTLSPELRQHPEILSMRVAHLQEQILDDRHDIDALLAAQATQKVEASHRHDYDVTTPMGKLPLPIALLILFGILAWRPDLAAKLIGQ
jgi:hypothetical protein